MMDLDTRCMVEQTRRFSRDDQMDTVANVAPVVLNHFDPRSTTAIDSQRTLYAARPHQIRSFSQSVWDTSSDIAQGSATAACSTSSSDVVSGARPGQKGDATQGSRNDVFQLVAPQPAHRRLSAQYGNVHAAHVMQPGGDKRPNADLVQLGSQAQQQQALRDLPGSTDSSWPAGHQAPPSVLASTMMALPPADSSSSGVSETIQYGSQATPGSCGPQYSSIREGSTTPAVCIYGMQMYVYRPVSYPDHVSIDALIAANDVMSRLTIPGAVKHVAVKADGRLFLEGRRFGFTAMTIALGSSYFQRLLAAMPHLEYAARRCAGNFSDYIDALPACSQNRWECLHNQYGSSYSHSNQADEDVTLASVQFTCCYLACKVVDRLPMLNMLRYILTTLYGSVVSKAQAYDVESTCLQGLGFRLGPYFCTDDLVDDWPF